MKIIEISQELHVCVGVLSLPEMHMPMKNFKQKTQQSKQNYLKDIIHDSAFSKFVTFYAFIFSKLSNSSVTQNYKVYILNNILMIN